MIEHPISFSIIGKTADILSKSGSTLAWLVVPKVMKKVLTNRINAAVEATMEAEIHEDNYRKKLNILSKFESIEQNQASTAELALGCMLDEALTSQANRTQIADYALKELEVTGEPLQDNETLDEDWKRRFYRYSSDISKKDAQKLWGKLLAGEILHPGSFSLRTLEFLRNMSQRDVQDFELAASHLLGPGIPARTYSAKAIHTWTESRPTGKICFMELFMALMHLALQGLVLDPNVPTRHLWEPGEDNAWRLASGRLVLQPRMAESPLVVAMDYVLVAPEFYELLSLQPALAPDREFLSDIVDSLNERGISFYAQDISLAGCGNRRSPYIKRIFA